MARMSPDDRREAIVAATLAVMLRNGIAGTTVRDVAAELGTSSGLIHHYVDSMDDLIAEAFERSATEDLQVTIDAVAARQEPVAQLQAFITSYGRGEVDSGMQLWLDAWSEASRRPALQRTSQTLNVKWQALLRDVIARGVAESVMTSGDPDASAWRLLSVLDGLALQSVVHPETISSEQARQWSLRAAELELGLTAGSLS